MGHRYATAHSWDYCDLAFLIRGETNLGRCAMLLTLWQSHLAAQRLKSGVIPEVIEEWFRR